MSDYLLDSSFVIDLLNELADGVYGPAVAWLAAHPRAHAESVARLQRKRRARLGENDAWQVAIAAEMKGMVLGHDRGFARLRRLYVDHRA